MKEKVLVLEDDVTLLKILGKGLGRYDYDLSLVSNIKTAFKLLKEIKFDYIVADIVIEPSVDCIPMSGIEFVRQAREKGIDCPVIFMTGLAMNSTPVVTLKRNGYIVIAKGASRGISSHVKSWIDNLRISKTVTHALAC